MSEETDDLSLPEALQECRRIHGIAPPYRHLWERVVDGSIEARRLGNRYVVSRNVLPAIADLARPRRVVA
jgi:hypothetical protein